jgi:molecular chaperone GrpE
MKLIPVIDDFDRAIEAAASDESAERFAQGISLIRAHFLKVLEDEGLTEIEAEGMPFDPHVHEAIMQEPSDEHQDEHVMEVLRKGYRLGDLVVRPAMVKIARNDG